MLSTRMLKTLIITIVLGILLTPLQLALAQTPVASPVVNTPVFEESSCMYDPPAGLTAEDVLCGWMTGPMYPGSDRPETVTLPVIKVLAVTDTPAQEPLVILLGGPGQDMSAVLPMFGDELPLWRFMLDRQDVILFDQRGMGQSTPSLACGFEQEGTPESDMAIGLSLMRCGADLQASGINPAAFTTTMNTADIESIRLAMQYDQVDLYGISYGSKLALSAVRDYPDSIRSTIIASPLPLENNPFADQTIGFDNALELLWEECAADGECAVANPDPAGDFVRATDRLKTEPMTITTTNPTTGDTMELKVDNYQFLQIVYLGVFIGPLAPMLPYLMTSVANGDASVLQMTGEYLLIDGGLSLGALFTYFCQDEVPFNSSEETTSAITAKNLQDPLTDGSWISLADQTYLICRMWKFPAAESIENEAVMSDEPLLILTGAFDPITPASNGPIVAANFPHGQWVNFTDQGHDPASFVPECSGPMILGFLDDPMAEVDSSCAQAELTFDAESVWGTPVASPISGAEDSD